MHTWRNSPAIFQNSTLRFNYGGTGNVCTGRDRVKTLWLC
jgi:hypothetical protein